MFVTPGFSSKYSKEREWYIVRKKPVWSSVRSPFFSLCPAVLTLNTFFLTKFWPVFTSFQIIWSFLEAISSQTLLAFYAHFHPKSSLLHNKRHNNVHLFLLLFRFDHTVQQLTLQKLVMNYILNSHFDSCFQRHHISLFFLSLSPSRQGSFVCQHFQFWRYVLVFLFLKKRFANEGS